MKKSNIEMLKEYYSKMDMTIENCDKRIDSISKVEFKKALNQMCNDSCDILTKIRGKHYIIEVVSYIDDNEVYINLTTLLGYANKYGELTLLEFLEYYGMDEEYEKGLLKH